MSSRARQPSREPHRSPTTPQIAYGAADDTVTPLVAAAVPPIVVNSPPVTSHTNVLINNVPDAPCAANAALRDETGAAFGRVGERLEGLTANCEAQTRSMAVAADASCEARAQQMQDRLGPFLESLATQVADAMTRLGALERERARGGGGAGGPPVNGTPSGVAAGGGGWSPGGGFVPALPILSVPLDLASWQGRLGTLELSSMAAAYAQELQAIGSHSLRMACTATLNSFLLTHNACVRVGCDATHLRALTEPSLRSFLAQAKTLQVYLAPRGGGKRLNDSFLPRAYAALTELPEMTPAAVDAAIRSVVEQVGHADTAFRPSQPKRTKAHGTPAAGQRADKGAKA